MNRSKPARQRASLGSTTIAGALPKTALAALLPAALGFGALSPYAQAQTWTGASDNQYGNALNWTPAVIPNGAGATATFLDSAPTVSIDLDQAVSVSGFSFNASTSAYTISLLGPAGMLTVLGAGLINVDSSQTQTLRVGSNATLLFQGNATIQDTTVRVDPSGTFALSGNASGGNGRMIVNGTATIAPGMGNVFFGSLEGAGMGKAACP